MLACINPLPITKIFSLNSEPFFFGILKGSKLELIVTFIAFVIRHVSRVVRQMQPTFRSIRILDRKETWAEIVTTRFFCVSSRFARD